MTTEDLPFLSSEIDGIRIGIGEDGVTDSWSVIEGERVIDYCEPTDPQDCTGEQYDWLMSAKKSGDLSDELHDVVDAFLDDAYQLNSDLDPERAEREEQEWQDYRDTVMSSPMGGIAGVSGIR